MADDDGAAVSSSPTRPPSSPLSPSRSPSSALSSSSSSSSSLEATELRTITSTLPPLSHIITPGQQQQQQQQEGRLWRWHDDARRLWRHQVRISVPHADCRDHLANERTFLGYLRSSLALAMLGTVVAQLYRLQPPAHPDAALGYRALGKPLAGLFQVAALLVVLLGGFRFWSQQAAMAVGRVRAGGWEVVTVAVGSFLLLFVMFVVHVVVLAIEGD